MAQKFHYWFLFGFISCCVSIIAALVEVCFHKVYGLIIISRLVQVLLFLSSIGWFIWGALLRFGIKGKIASGDFYKEIKQANGNDDVELDNNIYLVASGKFIKIYFIVGCVLDAVVLTICCGGLCIQTDDN